MGLHAEKTLGSIFAGITLGVLWKLVACCIYFINFTD